MTTRQIHDRIIGHDDLAAYAAAKVNLPKPIVDDRRAQLDYLTRRLEHYIGEHPAYDLIKIRGSGSVTKGTALKGSSDADMAAYVRAAAVGGVAAPDSQLLTWLRDRLIEVYGDTKRPEDFQVSDHAVGIVFHGSGLKVDVAPVIYEGDPDDRGYLVTRSGTRVLTSIRLHVEFIRRRKRDHGPGYAQLIRLIKAWVREQKRLDGAFREDDARTGPRGFWPPSGSWWLIRATPVSVLGSGCDEGHDLVRGRSSPRPGRGIGVCHEHAAFPLAGAGSTDRGSDRGEIPR